MLLLLTAEKVEPEDKPTSVPIVLQDLDLAVFSICGVSGMKWSGQHFFLVLGVARCGCVRYIQVDFIFL